MKKAKGDNMTRKERKDTAIKAYITINLLSFLVCASMLDGESYTVPLIIAGFNIISSFVAGLFYEGE